MQHPHAKNPGHPGGGHPLGHPGGHPQAAGAAGAPPLRLIAWEVTRACNLACKHCRAEACLDPWPGEFDTKDAKALIDTFPETGSPIIIFTGGEPLLRPDIFELVRHARSHDLRCVMAPNGTLITPENAREIKASGIARCSISIDAPTAADHDDFRGVPGAFEGALRGIEYLKSAGMEFQINTTVTRHNMGNFKEIFKLAEKLGAAAWHIFLLVPTGRAAQLGAEIITAKEYEEVLNWFYDFRKTIMRQRAKAEGVAVTPDTFGMDAMTRGCLGGTGFCFISAIGQVQPCGYLDLDCGQVREKPFPEIWRTSRQFLQFRNKDDYEGKCGVCQYHRVCGGCRARAQTMSGNDMAPEPLCDYTPPKAETGLDG